MVLGAFLFLIGVFLLMLALLCAYTVYVDPSTSPPVLAGSVAVPFPSRLLNCS